MGWPVIRHSHGYGDMAGYPPGDQLANSARPIKWLSGGMATSSLDLCRSGLRQLGGEKRFRLGDRRRGGLHALDDRRKWRGGGKHGGCLRSITCGSGSGCVHDRGRRVAYFAGAVLIPEGVIGWIQQLGRVCTRPERAGWVETREPEFAAVFTTGGRYLHQLPFVGAQAGVDRRHARSVAAATVGSMPYRRRCRSSRTAARSTPAAIPGMCRSPAQGTPAMPEDSRTVAACSQPARVAPQWGAAPGRRPFAP